VRQLCLKVDGSVVAGGTATTNGLSGDSAHVTVTENSSGDYTFTLNTPGQRFLSIQATPITDVTTCRVKSVTTEGAIFTIEQVGADQTTPEADADFYLLVVVSDAADVT
jgi:hypothetical protein